MTARQRVLTLAQLRDILVGLSLRRWEEEGWVVRPHLECKGKAAHEHEAILAWLDEDEHVLHLHPHPSEKDQPVTRTILHELVGHILLDLGSSTRDERLVERLEGLLWPILTRTQRKMLANLVGSA